MAGEYEKAITIEEAIDQIVARRYLLPAIQRKFTWKMRQICVFFDSIMRGYPISTFMFWKVTDPEIKETSRFYQFLERYCERFEENNPDFDIKGHDNFSAVIDGQQRLTSLYIGLKGTYAVKLSGKRWPRAKDDSIFPPCKLYLNLAAPLNEDEEANENEEMMSYGFEFLTEKQFKEDLGKKNKFWFAVGKILDFKKVENDDDVLDIVEDFLEENGQGSNKYARKTLTRLYFAMRRDNTIHFYRETSQEIDRVLNVFIRTNSGGTPLKPADLVMSLAVANWKKDARQQIDDLVYQIRLETGTGFSIDRDFVLKTALMLTDTDVQFKVKNFAADRVAKIEQEWDDIKACILGVFRLIGSFSLNDASLTAKNAAIPIAYYLFHKDRNKTNGKQGLYADINNKARHEEERKRICQWLHMSLLKIVFSGASDTILTRLRVIIRAGLSSPAGFPLDEIVTNYRGTRRDLTFDEGFIDRLLKTRKRDPSCFSILALLLPDLDFTQALDVDHLHPAISFRKRNLDTYAAHVGFGNPESRSFYEEPENWDSIANLHLLNSSKNKSKSDKPLEQWLAEQSGTKPEDLLIPEGTDLSFGAFESFIEARAAFLKERLRTLVGATHSTPRAGDT